MTLENTSTHNNKRKYKYSVSENTKRDSRKHKCSVLEVHISRKSARNMMKSSRGEFRSMRARSACIDNGKYRCSLSKVQSLS
jgi:hypothetical protein